MFQSLRGIFDTTAKRDRMIGSLINCVNQDLPPSYYSSAYNSSAAPLIDYYARNNQDATIGTALLSAIDTVKIKQGVQQAAATELEFILKMNDTRQKREKGYGAFEETLKTLYKRFENDLTDTLFLYRKDETGVYDLWSLGCSTGASENRQFANTTCNAFLNTCTQYFDNMAVSNKYTCVEFAHKFGDRDQKERASLLAEKLLPQLYEPHQFTTMLNIAHNTRDYNRREALLERLRAATL